MRVILNWGLGVDSTRILTEWLDDPASRDFPLGDLTVVTAQTGEEYADTKAVVEAHALPLLRRHGVRYVQVARAGRLKEEGYVVLSDTREPDRLFREGVYKLGDELLAAGTVPAVGNRRCSIKSKGVVIDAWLRDELRGEPFRQVMGFNADEQKRVTRDSCYGGDARNAEYPLMKWGFGRERCERDLRDRFGVAWPKSCCSFCPFARGKPEALARLAGHPEELADALYLEHLSLALNPLMPLYASGSLRGKLGPEHAAGVRVFEALLAAAEWAVYRVRRVYHAKGRADRSVTKVAIGRMDTMTAELTRLAAVEGQEAVVEAGSPRFYLARRQPSQYPAFEEMCVAAPADAEEKAKKSFESTWGRVALALA
jgi:hypothetical protein